MSSYRFINIGPEGIEGDFWVQNPQLKYLSPFSDLYDSDKSRKKVESSKTMWCIWMLMDPSYINKVFQQDDKAKLPTVKKFWPKFDKDHPLVDAIMKVYDDVCLSAIGRSYKRETATMVARADILATTAYSFDAYVTDPSTNRAKIVKGTSRDLDAMRVMSTKIYEGYNAIEKLFREEQDASRVVGGRTESVREMNLLREVKEDYE